MELQYISNREKPRGSERGDAIDDEAVSAYLGSRGRPSCGSNNKLHCRSNNLSINCHATAAHQMPNENSPKYFLATSLPLRRLP